MCCIGTNSETCFIGGAICAERAALCQLRERQYAKVKKVEMVTFCRGRFLTVWCVGVSGV